MSEALSMCEGTICADVSARVVQLRGYGNAIVPQVAAEFVVAAMEAMDMMEQRARDAERELKEAGV